MQARSIKMQKELNVVIVEDDPYARDFMSMLLRRDWRTRVVGEFSSLSGMELKQALRAPSTHVDMLLLDTEVANDENWPAKVVQMTRLLPRPPLIMFTCTSPEPHVLESILAAKGGGYIAKNEILYALATAITAAARGQFVITPGVLIVAGRTALPEHTLIMDGTMPVATFTSREKDLTRLGLLFNLAQREIADDLIISTDFVAEVMGHIYEKLGVREILDGEKEMDTFFQDEKLRERCQEILEQYAANGTRVGRKAPGMSTLAFHLLTVPESTEFN
jgi:DNA-binding NarL/FixJ family response regulator